MNQLVRVSIASLPMYLEAWLWVQRTDPDQILEMLISPVIQPTDKCVGPIVDFLATACFKEAAWEVVKDPMMMFGRAGRTEWTIYGECPGTATGHNCIHQKRAGDRTPWLNTGR